MPLSVKLSPFPVEPFCITIVGSELIYQCQSGFLPEGSGTLLCGEDGRWNPEPQSLSTGKICFTIISPLTSLLVSVSDESLSTAAVTAITAVVCSLVTFIACWDCVWCIDHCLHQQVEQEICSSKPAPNTQEQQQAAAVYEEVDTLQSQKIELKENVAYGPMKPNQ